MSETLISNTSAKEPANTPADGMQSGAVNEAPLTGLTQAEVEARKAAGKSNRVEDNSTMTVKGILISNIFTYFNGIFALLTILLISVGAWRNLTFLPVIIANTVIGIVQQLRAKSVLDKLSLLDVSEYTVIRGGVETKIPSDDLVEGDFILLTSGQQIPADGEVISGELAANESLLTGESDEITKVPGSELKSGSFVVSGNAVARLLRVGAESYASRLTAQAKETKESQAEMIRDIERVILVCGILIIPVGIALVVQAFFFNHEPIEVAISSMVGAVIGMIPEGMYLLATIALTLSAARLALKKVLLHDMRSIETLARVDVLCVDKTGTITTEQMNVDEIFDEFDDPNVQLLADYIHCVPDNNSTMQALRDYVKTAGVSDSKSFIATAVTPFTSKLKYSEVETADHTYRLGAPEYLLSEEEVAEQRESIELRTREGKRVIALTCDGEAVLFVALTNEIRESAVDTFAYFKRRGVEVKVISGDNPVTVSQVATQAGIANADQYCDATTLESRSDILSAVQKYTVFGRVKPEQKREMVIALKALGKKVAMTGDGVNDILAMKKADCSIAMGGGSDAARQAAQVVLLDSDFSHMEQIVSEGRRDVNNITRSATLFLYKNIFSLLLAIFAIVNSFTYPLQPNQVSLISLFNIGMPAFLLALEPNEGKQEGRFILRTLKRALPASLTSFFSIAALVLFGQLFEISSEDISTASTYLLAVVGFMILWQISHPFNWYHAAVYAACIIGLLFSASQLKFIFALNSISLKAAALCAIFAIAEISVMRGMILFVDWMAKGRHLVLKKLGRI